ncbi:VOC family protein [Lentzea sp. NPDC051213]|uniref:VOC family protein n=1 Tax=Lentzea sp. NPDC051213 TaxID=3364126 RepID=UPI0037B09005
MNVPTARAVDHVAWTVADLDEAVAFVEGVLGGGLCYRQGPIEHPGSDWMARKLGVHPRASADIALLRFGPVTNLELFGYRAPDQSTTPPRPWDVGAHHLVLRATGDAAAAVRAWAGTSDFETLVETPLGRVELRDSPDLFCYTVADLAASVKFFVSVLGAELVSRNDFRRCAEDGPALVSTVDPEGQVARAVLRLGPVAHVELVEHRVEGMRTTPPRNSDVGGHHLAFYAEDVDAAARYLAEVPGVEVMGTPETVPDGPIAGDRWVYFRTPIGIQMEVLNMPDGSLPYERTTQHRRATVRDWFPSPTTEDS